MPPLLLPPFTNQVLLDTGKKNQDDDDAVSGCQLNFNIKNAENVTVMSGELQPAEDCGEYKHVFEVTELPGIGNFTLEVIATKDGYE